MTETIEFQPVSDSYEDLGKLIPGKFSNVHWIEDQKPSSKELVIDGQRCEIFSTGLQLIGEGGSVTAHKEAEDVSEWVVPLWTLGWEPDSKWGGLYKVEDNPNPLNLIKKVAINSLVNARYSLRMNPDNGPELLISDSVILRAYEMPAGKLHAAQAMAPCLYFVFKTKPISA